MTTPAQNYDHIVKIVSGPLEPHTLQYGAAFKSGEEFVAGALVSMHTDGTLQAGCSDTAMPMWAINGVADLDVASEGVAYAGGNGISGGDVNAYVAVGGYELFTTEYDAATGNTYTPNLYLTPATGSDEGLVTLANMSAYSTQLVCGVVSRGVVTEKYSTNVLYFWPVFIPPVNT